ncbi:hypothetical protein ABFA07_023508 [Porites harrisoni]
MADKEECITEISSFLTETARRVESILQKLKWNKETLLKEANKSKIVHCPVNPSHRISTSRFEKHLSVCQYTSKGLKPQDVSPSPEFFYQTSKSVIPVFIETNSACSGQSRDKEGTVGDTSTDNEIRSIMSWEVVPPSHRKLQLHLLSPERIREWIIENLPKVQYLSSLEGASDRLVSFVLSCLQEEKVANPEGMEQMLQDLLGNGTQLFVLNLWKFLAVSIAKENCQASVEKAKQDLPLPMDHVISELSPQQRLAVYEHVVEVSKAKREGPKEDLDAELDPNLNQSKDEENSLPKSRFEVLAEQRDYKRRRQSYRAKNVHITKRSAVDVMRDLIETQMHVLEMQLRGEHGTSGNNSTEEGTSEDKESRDGRTDLKDCKRRESRDDEGQRETERNRRQHNREGNKRVRYYDDRDAESKRSRR